MCAFKFSRCHWKVVSAIMCWTYENFKCTYQWTKMSVFPVHALHYTVYTGRCVRYIAVVYIILSVCDACTDACVTSPTVDYTFRGLCAKCEKMIASEFILNVQYELLIFSLWYMNYVFIHLTWIFTKLNLLHSTCSSFYE